MDILIKNVAVLDAQRESMAENQNIVVTGTRIERVTGEAVEPEANTRVIDGRNRLAIPGLVNAHAHSPENFLKGRSEALPLELWLFELFWPPFAFTEREIYLACQLGAIEMLKTGTSAVVDHFWVNGPMTTAALDAAMTAYQDIGLRAGIAPLVEDDHKMNQMLIEREPGLAEAPWGTMPPITAAEYLDVLAAFFEKWHGAADGRLRCLAGPSGAQWCSLDVMRGSMDIADQYGSGFHMHVNETKLQAISCREFFGKPTIVFLDDNGLLKENSSLAHCVWITEDEIARIAASGATVAHNSVCNLKLGSGFAPILDLVEQGAHVALSADGAASNDNQNMFDVMKVGGLMHTVRSTDHHRWLRARQILGMATLGGARVLGLQDELGAIAEGRLADLTLLDLTTANFTPLNDPAQHLVYTENGSSVRTVLVNGQVIVEEGVVLTVDEAAILAEAREAWERRKPQIPPLTAEAHRYLEAQERLQQQALASEWAPDRY